MLQVVHEFKLKMMEVRTFSDLTRSRKGDLEGEGVDVMGLCCIGSQNN